MTLSDFKDLAAIVSVLVAAAVSVKALTEYVRQSAQKRADFFFSISKRIESNRTYVQILQMLEADDPKVAEVPLGDRRELLGLFEEVAILLNSGLVRESVAHYFFGYFAIDCWESGPMWTGLDRESPHWIVLRDFVSRMKDYGARASYDRSRYRF